MAGLLRNLLTILLAAFRYGSVTSSDKVNASFLITPFDTGFSVLKSDRYFQLAEAAQIDFLMRTGLMGGLVKKGYQFVNLAQLVKFARPVPVLSQVMVTSHVAYWDDKSAVFEHRFTVKDAHCARVLVRMKFKKSGRTIAPSDVLGLCSTEKPQHLTDWENLVSSI